MVYLDLHPLKFLCLAPTPHSTIPLHFLYPTAQNCPVDLVTSNHPSLENKLEKFESGGKWWCAALRIRAPNSATKAVYKQPLNAQKCPLSTTALLFLCEGLQNLQ